MYLRFLFALACLCYAAPAEGQLLRRLHDRGDRVNVRVRARFAPQPRFYDVPRFYEAPRFYDAPRFAPYYFPRDRFSIDLRLRSRGGCVGGFCP